ncbi:MAG: hypothetical protein Q8M94_08315 [Ignavibacteria bacterium]|nr:hypothetical protein [Ignavibacteria bacterium]
MDMKTQIRQALARGYCSPENEQKVLDPVLIEAMTRELLELFTPTRTAEISKLRDEMQHREDYIESCLV